MSDVAKKARAAMKAKAQRLGSDRSTEKVDSSTWTPPELLNAQAKTGMRPISRRQFKSGGKVVGEAATQRADRMQRSGKKPLTADSFVNKNMKEANEERPGIKHIGGMKKGGRATREEGGLVADYDTGSRTGAGAVTQSRSKPTPPMPQRRPPEPDYDEGSHTGSGTVTRSRKAGGRTKKNDGGAMGPAISGASEMIKRAQDTGSVPTGRLESQPASSRLASIAGFKKGGKAEPHEDIAADKALIKKMVKPSARTGKAKGGGMPLKGHNYHAKTDAELRYIAKDASEAAKAMRGMDNKAEGKYLDQANDASTVLGYRGRGGQRIPASSKGDDTIMNTGGRAKRATGGGIFSGASYPGKVPGAVPGGRTARATGGKTKGKTAINIVINAGKPAGQDGLMPPGGPPMPPKGMPIPVPPPAGGMPPGAAPPMPMPMPGPAGPAGPPGMPPMGRKAGGRTYRSYKDMDAGAGSGLGRLEKTEIAKHKGGIQRA